MEENWREVDLANPAKNFIYGTNTVSTTRHSLLGFVPLSLLSQFKRVPIVWFIGTGILQAVYSDLYAAEDFSTLIMIGVMIAFTMAIAAAQDGIRYVNDKAINSRPVELWDGTKFSNVECKSLRVGHLVHLKTGDTAPADLLILAGSNNGNCLADLKLLTGRKNCSEKTSVRESQILLDGWQIREEQVKKLEGDLLLPQPNSDIGQFHGKLRLKGYPRAAPLSISNFLPRGSVILKTESLLCLTVYVGVETKMMINNKITRRKVTLIENCLNQISLFIVAVTAAISIICAAASEAMNWDDDLNFGEHLVSFLLLYQHVIPITLFFLLDSIRLAQLVIIQRDGRFKLTTCDITDAIGQVEYLVTDKTGTLTSADLKLKMCRVGATEFLPNPEFSVESEESVDNFKLQRSSNLSLLNTSSQPFASLVAAADKEVNKMFLQSLVLCNTVNLTPNTELLGSSADEVALVEGADNFGYKLIEKSASSAKVQIGARFEEFVIHSALPFDPETRRMIAVVQEQGSKQAVLLIKGPRDSIKALCNIDIQSAEELAAETQGAIKCLRSIAFCYKFLGEDETQTLLDTLEYSKGAANEEGRVRSAIDEQLNGLSFIGSAYLQESLLPQVTETVLRLKSAGVKIWMATGDSAHSAYSIAVQSRITSLETENLALTNFSSQFDLKRLMTKAVKRCIYGEYDGLALSRLNQPAEPYSARNNKRAERSKSLGGLKISGVSGAKLYKAVQIKTDKDQTDFLEEPYDNGVLKYTLTVDGPTLELVVSDPELRKIFMCLAFAAEAVLACAMLPSQKADLVRLLQKNLSFKPKVMAVGDGVNDIAMIRQANVGVGISSKFNSQAANSSDLMTKSFNNIADLILTHGLKSHVGLSKALLLAIYGNLTMTLMLFYFNFTSDNSASAVIDPLFSECFCLLFFILPIFCIGVVDDTASEPKLVTFQKSIKFAYFCKPLTLRYIVLSLIHSGILFLYVYPVFWGIVSEDGYTETQDLIGVTLCIALVLTVLLQAALDMNRMHPGFVVTELLSVAAIYIFAYSVSQSTGNNMRLETSFARLQNSPPAIIVMLLAPVACFSISLIGKIFRQARNPVQPEGPFSRLMDFATGLDKVFCNYNKWKADIEKEVYNIDKLTVKFKSTYTEVKFLNFYFGYKLKAIRLAVGVLALAATGYCIAAGALGDDNPGSNFLRAAFAALLGGLFTLTFVSIFKQVYIKVTLAVIAASIVGKFALEIVTDASGTLASSFTPSFIFMLTCVDYIAISLLSVANILLTQISQAIHLDQGDASAAQFALVMLRLLVLTVGITVICAAVRYAIERQNRERFKLIEISEQEVQKTQAILSFLLPSFVKERVKEGARYIAEDQGTVTVVFIDIYDFDRICSEYEPSDLTELLDELFRKLDQLCDVHGVTKIETVGKTYMACAGLKDSEADMPVHLLMRSHARRGVDIALDVIRTVKLFKLKYGETLKVKIGVNSGPVTAGVVGYHKPQFALVGDTVNTASRMCSTLPEPNSIQITAATYDMLGRYEGLDFQDNQVEAKGKGTMHTKFVRENLMAGGVVHGTEQSFVVEPVVQPTKPLYNKVYEDEQLINRSETELISSIFDCQWKETAKQKKFRINLLESAFPVMQLGIATSLLVNCFLLLFAILEYNLIDNYAGPAQIACRVVLTVVLSVLLVKLKKVYKSRKYMVLVGGITLLHAITAMMCLIEQSDLETVLAASEVIFALLCLCHSSGLFLVRVVPLSFVVLVLWIGLAEAEATQSNYVVSIIYIAFVILVNSFAVYYRESNVRTFANLKLAVDKENQKTESLLSQMMPAHVYENLKEDRAVTDRLPNVAMLFADICGFTAWSSNKTPIEVVGMLSELFTCFDMLCVQYDVFKVCTIGDCYVVMGYTGLEYRDPASECSRVLTFAFDMLQVIRDLNTKHGSELNMRIGLHIGEVIAGITGTNIVRYDIYGADVQIANKMESGGQPGRINVSDAVRAHVESNEPTKYTYEFNTDITAKSINRTHKSYFVTEAPPPSAHRLS